MSSGPEALDMDGDGEFDELMRACQDGDLTTIKVSLGARRELVNGYNASWWTPVMKAALGGQPGAVQLLVDARADVNAANERGTTALILSVYTSQEPQFVECVKALLAAGADKSIQDSYEQNALSYAKDDEHVAAIELLS
jgi:ankyrin repeat protein